MLRAFFKETLQSALSQRVVSIVTILMIAGMCAAVLLTTGRTAGAEQEVIDSIDSAGTKTILVRIDPAAGVDSSAVERLETIQGVSTVVAFSNAFDVTNSFIGDSKKVPARLAYGNDLHILGIEQHQVFPNITGFVSQQAGAELGLSDGVGSVEVASGGEYFINGVIDVPDYLAFLEPVLLVPQSMETTAPVTLILVVAERPEHISALPGVIIPLLDLVDPTKITIETSQEFAELRALVEGQLGSFGRELVLIIFVLTAGLVAVILYSFVLLKRKDFGRRRALGASQSLIIGLILAQTAILSIVGAVAGLLVATVILVVGGNPLPGAQFFLALVLLSVLTGLFSALLPAWFASKRDPIRELRVP